MKKHQKKHFWNIALFTRFNIYSKYNLTIQKLGVLSDLNISFILAHFGLKQNPTGLKEAIQRSDKNSKTASIIKSTLARTFPIKKHRKNHFWNIALFTRFNLTIGHLRVTSGHLRVTVGHIRVTLGHLRVTLCHFRVT